MPPNAEQGGTTTIRQRKDTSHITKKVASEYDDEILIDGIWYNITDFVKHHPGGRIINFYRGKNATEAFNEFHIRSKSAHKRLALIKKQRPDNGVSKLDGNLEPLTKDFNALRQQFKDEGLFDPSYPHIAYRITELIAMHAIGFWLLSVGWVAAGIVMLGVVQGRCGWFMHEGGHCSLTGNVVIDIPIQVVTYGFGCGMSASFWRNQHNKHHATPQKIGHDVDLDTLPLVMFSSVLMKEKQAKLVNKTWIRLQPYLFAPLTCLLVALGWQLFLHPRHAFRTGRFHELASMAARYAVLGYMMFAMESSYSASQIFAGYITYVWLGSAYIFCNFAVSHTHLPVLNRDEDVSWVRYASDHTMNVKSGPFGWVDWWMSYLNYQIEHHLFPSMPQFNHPKISPRVQALFKKHGVTYMNDSYTDAMKRTFKNLDQVGQDVFYG
eukprot:m.35991 g.35991  ORF g.35991 m.35991 type:complete len:437 (-) comp17233_c0_seq1:173-1483(-)